MGCEDFAVRLRNLVLGAATPVAITIGGRWGAGKTSMLRALMASLDAPLEESSGEGLPKVLKPTDEAGNKALQAELKHVWPIWFNP